MSNFPETSLTMIERMRNGEFSDLGAWSRSCERYYAPARRYVCWRLGVKSAENRSEFDDIVQDAFIRMWKKFQKDGFDRQRTGSFRAYFESCIRSAINDYLRVAKRIKEDLIIDKPIEDHEGNATEVSIPDPNQHPDYVSEEEKQQLIKCFWEDSMRRVMRRSHLSETHRLIVQLIFEGELISVIAEKCKTTADNVRHVHSRYVKAVRNDLDRLAAQEFLLSKEDRKYYEDYQVLKLLKD